MFYIQFVDINSIWVHYFVSHNQIYAQSAVSFVYWLFNIPSDQCLKFLSTATLCYTVHVTILKLKIKETAYFVKFLKIKNCRGYGLYGATDNIFLHVEFPSYLL